MQCQAMVRNVSGLRIDTANIQDKTMRRSIATLCIFTPVLVISLFGCAALTPGPDRQPPARSANSEPTAQAPVSQFTALTMTSDMRAGLTLNRPFEPVAVYQFKTHRDNPAVPEGFSGLSSLRLLSVGRQTIRFEVISDSAQIGVLDMPNVMADAPPAAGETIAQMVTVRAPEGNVLSGSQWADAESIAPTPTGRLIGLERNHRLLHLTDEALRRDRATTPGPQLTGFEGLEANGGMEALTRLPDGRYLASAEYGRSDQGAAQALKPPYWVFRLDQAGPIAPLATFENPAGFGVTEARVHEGHLWLLKRSWVQATNTTTVQLVSCPLGGLLAGKPVCTTEMTIAAPFPIDNYEGLEIIKDPSSGDHFFFILSDDNVSASQKTLFLCFKLPKSAMPQ
jgi:hypothetical protein